MLDLFGTPVRDDVEILVGDCREVLRGLPAGSVHCCVTSPPYFGLRDYKTGTWDGGDVWCDHTATRRGHDASEKQSTSAGTSRDSLAGTNTCRLCGATRVDRQIGLEDTPDAYVAALVAVFSEVRRVLRDDATLWLNLGDSFVSSSTGSLGSRITLEGGQSNQAAALNRPSKTGFGIPAKNLIGIPWRVAFALQADGWWLRSDIIWCLSGGTRVYARTQKGEAPMTIKDMVRLDPTTVQLWNGDKWTQVLGWSETPRPDRTYEIELRSGQRIGCTAGHEWPTQRGLVRADALRRGDIVASCRLPEPPVPKRPEALDDNTVGWFVGLYIAEGSRHDGTISIASHTKEALRFERLDRLAKAFHGTAAVHKKTSVNGCTVALNGPMLEGLVDTYVSGRIASDKHLHPRCWQRSDTFLRAVLDGYLSGDGHFDAKNDRWRLGFCTNDELVADLRTVGARLGVSVRLKRVLHKFGDREFPGYKGELRFTRSAHGNSRDDGEVIAIRESRARRFWDIGVADEPHTFALASGVLTHNSKPNPMPESVTDRPTSAHEHVFLLTKSPKYYFDADAVREEWADERQGKDGGKKGRERNVGSRTDGYTTPSSIDPSKNGGRNIRNVWTITPKPFRGAHFATFPPALVEPCVKAGCPIGGLVLDPFGGSGTVGIVARQLGRRAVLVELNPDYAAMARERVATATATTSVRAG